MSETNVIKKSSLTPTVLIVGGAGFIGSHLAEALLQKDARVVVVDNFSTGKDIYVNNLLDNPKFALFNVDINQGLPKEIQSVDYIFQLAGLETYLFDKEDITLESLLTNALGIKNILDFTQQCSAKLLLASTIDVYKGLISPLSLDQYFGQTPEEEKKYSLTEAKRYAEALVWEYYKKHEVNVRIARLPEVYGPRMNLDSSGSLGLLIKSLVENNDLIVYGDGIEKEYYIYITDAVVGLIKALFTENTSGKIFTFAGSDPHSVLEMTYLVKGLANSETRVVFKPKPAVIQAQEPRIPDRSTLKDLNWEEKVVFKEGIIKTLRWLGYEPNEHAFKPAKLVEQKVQEAQKKDVKEEKESIFSIADLKKEPEKASVTYPPPTPPPVPQTNIFKPPVKQKPSILGKFGFSTKKKGDRPKAITPLSAPYQKPAKTFSFFKLMGVFVALLALLVVLIGVPLLQTYMYANKGASYLKASKTELLSLNSTEAQRNADNAFKEFYRAQVSLGKVTWLFALVGKRDYINDVQGLLSSAENTSKAAYFLAKGSESLTLFWQAVKPNSDTTFDKESFDRSRTSFVNAQSNLRLAEAELQQVDIKAFSSEIQQYASDVEKLSNSVNSVVTLTSSLEDVLGVNSKRTYLVLFQNSNELRATGGFIGSYAILELESGKIENLVIDDVYNPDGQIDLREIQVIPPEPIQTYLEEEALHIRNANWDPDFAQSANQIKDLFFRLDGREFDGVIAVDLYFVQNLLEATGPVFLTAYNEEITYANLYERAQFHSEFNYESGSDQKRSFLTVLGGKMLEKLFSLDRSQLVSTSGVLKKSLDEKHMLVNIPNSSINALLSENNWNGSLVNVENSDYLYVVNSNVGGTKANYYVEDSMSYSIYSKTRDGLLRGELVLNYNHTGVDGSWPGGPYTNYVRVLTPSGSKLTGVKLTTGNNPQVDVFDSVTVSKIGKYNSFEFAFILDPQKSASLKFDYDLSPELNLTMENKNYNLYWQKQPGTQDDPIKFNFNAPFGISVVATTPPMTVGASSAEYSGVLNTDTRINLVMQ